jgi:hypothetical protein
MPRWSGSAWPPPTPDVLLISGTEWNDRRLAPHGQVLGPRQLRLDHVAAGLAAQALKVELPPASLGRLVAVTAGAAGAVHAALSAAAATGCEDFEAAVAAAASGTALLAGLGRNMLARASEDTRIALAGAVRLGVWHPGLGTALRHGVVRWDEPWWIELDEEGTDGRFPLASQPTAVRMTLRVGPGLDAAHVDYTAEVAARSLADSHRHPLVPASGTAAINEPVALELAGPPLPPGIYRLEARVVIYGHGHQPGDRPLGRNHVLGDLVHVAPPRPPATGHPARHPNAAGNHEVTIR